MPSDLETRSEGSVERTGRLAIEAVLERLSPALEPFRSAVAEAGEEVRVYRARHEELSSDPAGRMARELGPFARGRIDPLRLVGLLGDGASSDPLADRIMAVARERFLAAGSGGAGSHRVSVPAGEDLRDAVKEALAEVGRVFATAQAVEKARLKRYEPDRDHALLHAHPFHRWTPRERSLAPPLVVEVDGAGLRGAGLLEFMEGGQKFVLLVRGSAPPAPLARLATPGVFVAQVGGASGLDAVGRLADHDGPGAVALFEEGAGALSFVHTPDGRVEVDPEALRAARDRAEGMPGQPGGLDLRYLSRLVTAALGTAPPAEGDPVTPVSPGASDGVPPTRVGTAPGRAGAEPTVDQLADWLLARVAPGEE